MSSSWVIGIPVWGYEYCKVFAERAAPSLRAALDDFPHDTRFIIHTDQSAFIRAALAGFDVETIPIGRNPTYVALQNAHADAIARAHIGERVALLNADIVVSRNLFWACEDHIASGKKAVVTSGVRTVKSLTCCPPIGAKPRELLSWAWMHRHQIIKDLEWGASQGSMIPTNLFFVRNGSVSLHGFHLHPVAILKERDLSFQSTIDGDLLEHFPRESIHVVTHPDDLAMCEISDVSRRFPVRTGPLTPALVATSMATRASNLHCWLFEHRIQVIEEPQKNDAWIDPIVREVLRLLVPRINGPRITPTAKRALRSKPRLHR